MSVINYYKIYSLDFSYADHLKKMIGENQDEFAKELRSALNAERMKSGIARSKDMETRIGTMLSQLNFEQTQSPGYQATQKYVSDIQAANAAAENVLFYYNGADPSEIQNLVHKMLGIPKSCQDQSSNELQRQYFDLMRTSGLLITEEQTIEQPINYRPEILALECLEQHPEKKTLIIGCGEARKTYVASCHFRRAEDHVKEALTIDISAVQQPDLIVDMHDPDFWKVIPEGYFENIFDHSYGRFLFENSQSEETIGNIFRSLAPGGILKMDHSFQEEHKLLLQKAGFILEEGEQKEARKPV